MAKTLTNTATKVATKLGTEPLIILKVDWGSGDVFYSDKNLGLADGTTADNAIGIIINSSSLNMQMKSSSAAAVNSVDFALDDSNGSLKTILDTVNIYTLTASIYLYYPDGSYDLILHGKISSPIEWSESERILQITVETQLNSETIGYAVSGDDVSDPPDGLVGTNWPLCFGTVKKVPAIKLNKIPYGTIKSELVRTDQTIRVEGGGDFPQGIEGTYILGGNKITGTFSGETFTITNYDNSDGGLQDLYTTVACADRVVGDVDENNYKVVWIADDSIELAGLKCLDGTTWRYCYRQEGTKCYFNMNWPTLRTSADSFDSAGEKGLNAWAGTGTWGWAYGAGTAIYPTSSTEEIWACNYFDSTTIYSVSVERELDNGDKVLVTVPDDFYTIDTSYDSSAIITGGPTCTVIKLVKPLKHYRYSDLGNQLFVNLLSAKPATQGDNTASQIEYILDTYTNLTPDSTTFTAVKTSLANYPSNFMTTSRQSALDFIEAMAYQSRCSLTYRNGIAYIHYLSEEPTSILSLSDSDIIKDTLVLSTTDFYDVVTSLKGDWVEDYNSDPHINLKELNVSNYGLSESGFSLDIYTQEECVEKTMSFYSKRMANIWRKIKFSTGLTSLSLDTFDCFELTLAGNHVSTGAIKCIVEDVIHNPETSSLDIVAWTPIVVGTKIANSNAWLDDSGDSKPTLSVVDETADYFPELDLSSSSSSISTIYNTGSYDASDGITIANTDIAVNADTDDFQFNESTGALELKSTGTQTRRAKIQSVSTLTISVRLLDSDGLETGDAITVYPVEHLGTNDLSGDVWPKLAATDIISIFQDLNSTWYTTFIFDDTDEECVV